MRQHLIALATAAFLMGSATSIVKADDLDKKTYITVNDTILIPGKTLAPGKYVMKLVNPRGNRHIVQIFNEDQSRLEATILAFSNFRLQRPDKTVLQYWETPAGSPPALRAWFYPGDPYGQEFAYPKEKAEELARLNNNASVPQYNASNSTDFKEEEFSKLEVTNIPEEQVEISQAAPVPAPAPIVRSESTTLVVRENRPAAVDNTLLAQNTPAPPVFQERPVESVPAPANELPRTASNTPWILAIGLLALGSAVGLKSARKA